MAAIRGCTRTDITGCSKTTIKTKDIVDGFDLSGTYYLPNANNLGLVIDGSGHFNKSQGTGVGYILGGLQYKYHTDTFSPFVRAFVGLRTFPHQTRHSGASPWAAAAALISP